VEQYAISGFSGTPRRAKCLVPRRAKCLVPRLVRTCQTKPDRSGRLQNFESGGVRVCLETNAEIALRRSTVRARSAPPKLTISATTTEPPRSNWPFPLRRARLGQFVSRFRSIHIGQFTTIQRAENFLPTSAQFTTLSTRCRKRLCRLRLEMNFHVKIESDGRAEVNERSINLPSLLTYSRFAAKWYLNTDVPLPPTAVHVPSITLPSALI
jgi:hypothetical protein